MKAILIGVASVLAVSAAVAITASVGGAVGAFSCVVPVSGGTAVEQAGVERILCKMSHTTIEGVQILDQPPSAPSDALWLAISIPKPCCAPSSDFTLSRSNWEANVAAGAIRDGFERLRLPRVVAYGVVFTGDQPDSHRLHGIALPSWGIPQWAQGTRPQPRGGHTETWALLQSKLGVLTRRFGVRTRLSRYEPFGKAPLVTVWTSQPTAFIDYGGFDAFEQALHFKDSHFDGVLLRVLTGTVTGVQVETVHRGQWSLGCTIVGHIKHSSKVCQGD